MIEEAPFAFARASSRDPWLHGAERPGYNLSVPIPEEPIHAWIKAMYSHGIRRVICLLAREQLDYYTTNPLSLYNTSGLFTTVSHAPIKDFSAPPVATLHHICALIQDAEEAHEPVVVHCSAGYGRTGLVLAAWLIVRYGVTVNDAIGEVIDFARGQSVWRNPLEAGSDSQELLEALF